METYMVKRYMNLVILIMVTIIATSVMRHYELWFWFGVTNFLGGAWFSYWFSTVD